MDELYTNYYPAYTGGGNQHVPLESDIAPLQTIAAGGLAGPSAPQPHHMPLIMWALLFIGGAFILMHMADR